MTPAEIRLLFQSTAPAAELSADEVEDVEEVVADDNDNDNDSNDSLSAAECARRTEALRQVLTDVKNTWKLGSPELNQAAEYLGDGSRDTSWRRPIGESGLLDYFGGLLASADELPLPLKTHSLRLIGNSCADQDENRARVVDGAHLGHIVALLQDDSVLCFAVPVLYNICVDYEPAQRQASQAGLSKALVAIVTGPRRKTCAPVRGVILKLLALLVTQEPETSVADPATPSRLLYLAANHSTELDVDDFALLVNVALAYLGYETFQEHFIQDEDAVFTLLGTFSDDYLRHDVTKMDPDDANDYRALATRFLNVLSDLTALPSFAAAHPLASSAVVRNLQTWLMPECCSRLLQTAACVALGNLSRSDEASNYLVHDDGIHATLAWHLMPAESKHTYYIPSSSPTDGADTAQLTFAALSFLKNLAIPPANRAELGKYLLDHHRPLLHLWAGDAQPQIQLAAVSLARLLLTACPANVVRAATITDPTEPQQSQVHALLALFQRSDAENIRTETARALLALCRVLHDGEPDRLPLLPEVWEPKTPVEKSSDDDDAGLRQRRRSGFYDAHAGLADVLGFLVAQTRFPALRPETWFVGALMCRSSDGAGLVLRALAPEATWGALVTAVGGPGALVKQTQDPQVPEPLQQPQQQQQQQQQQQVTPEQAAATARAERENALVLLAELVKNYADQLPFERLGQAVQLLQTGGALVVGDRGQ